MRCARAWRGRSRGRAKKSRKKTKQERNRRLTDCRQTKDNRAGQHERAAEHAGRVIERKKANGKDAGARCVVVVVAARSS